MKKIIYIIVLILILISCCPSTWINIGNGDNMKYEFDSYYTKTQFDSICLVNHVNNDLSKWVKLPLIDDETNERGMKYMFIQRIDSVEIIYTVLENSIGFKINKRVTY